jgi:ribitol 2-dehydrogenase
MAGSLSGKTVIITGASSGIGRATALTLAREGARLVLAARSVQKLDVLNGQLGGQALVVPTDVSRPEDHERLVETAIRHYGQIDVLFANAGLFVRGAFNQADPAAWAQLLSVNVNGVLHGVRCVLPHMLRRGAGDILVTSSISGHQAIHGEPVYSASKHAIQAFVHGLRRQVASAGIRVGAVAPGVVLNELWGHTDPAEIDRLVGERAGLRSEDVAEAVLFMLARPPHVTIRDLVILPQNQDI